MRNKFDFFYIIESYFSLESNMAICWVNRLQNHLIIIMILLMLVFMFRIVLWCITKAPFILVKLYKIGKKLNLFILVFIDLFTIIYISLIQIKNKLLKRKGRLTQKKFFSSLFLGFCFDNAEAITYLFYKVKAFYIKYKIIIVIISCVVAAATIAYTAYSFYYLTIAYNASYGILVKEIKPDMLGRYVMFRENIGNFIAQHMPETLFREWLRKLNGRLLAAGLKPIITQNLAGLEHYLIDDNVVACFSKDHNVNLEVATRVFEEEIILLNPLGYEAFADGTKSAVEKAQEFNATFKEIGELVKEQEDIIKKGGNIVKSCIVIVVFCVVTGTIAYLNLPDVTPLINI